MRRWNNIKTEPVTERDFMNKLCKIIRVITVAPIFAFFTVSMLYLFSQSVFYDITHYYVSVLTLTVLPLLAYPISMVKSSDCRRHFQRSLAIVFSVAGYIGGLIYAIATRAANGELVLYLTYLLSGAAIAFSSFVLKRKSSGHTCGISGPVALLAFYISPYYLFAFILLIPVFMASLELKRHTFWQLISGCVIPIICLFISICIL